MRTQIGTVYVDAGIVMVGDPCYTLPDDGSHRGDVGKDWSKFCDKMFEGDTHNGVEPFGKGIGIVVSSGYGDGSYPVFVEHKDGHVKSLTVEFFSDDEEEDDSWDEFERDYEEEEE